MKKIVLLPVIILFFALASFAQSYEGTIQFDKKKQTAIVCDYSYPAQAVENAFVKRMEQLGYKAKEEKVFLTGIRASWYSKMHMSLISVKTDWIISLR